MKFTQGQIKDITDAVLEAEHERNIRKSYGANGIFDASQYLSSFGAPPVVEDHVEHKDDSGGDSDDGSEKAGVRMPTDLKAGVKKHLATLAARKAVHSKVTTINGKQIVVKDYAMQWEGLDASTMDSTHEITFSPIDKRFLWVTGMMDNQIARVSVADPRRAQFFQFPPGMQPHTIRFDKSGNCWVGLEAAGCIVKLRNLGDWDGESDVHTVELVPEVHYELQLDVRINPDPKCSSIPCPINTHPHGFCFDSEQTHIWFTGKLTNTVGRVNIETEAVQHFQLPTLGAVPIYVALGPDKNVWGTCLANNNIFRVTTGDHPIVTEIPITPTANNSRPIIIKPAPHGENYMWFSNEASHSVCKVSCEQVEEFVRGERDKQKKDKQRRGEGNTNSTTEISCTCSKFFYAASTAQRAVTEFRIPMPQHNMLLAGIAFDREGNLWTQSYVDSGNPHPEGPDYVIKVDNCIHNATKNRNGSGRMTGIPFEFYEAPTTQTNMHRIIDGPDGNVWFTELGADRIGTVTVKDVNSDD